MVKLLKLSDNSVLSREGFVKNAVFYKDLFAFYDAYTKLMEKDEVDLPSYIFYKKRYVLDGICLFMKNYASELGFESIHLTLDYLKVIYYTIASYSKDENLPDRNIFEIEFQEFCETADNMHESALAEFDVAKKAYNKAKADLEIKTKEYAMNLIWSKFFNIFSIFFIIAGFVAGMIPFTFYFLNKFAFGLTLISSSVCVAVGFGVSIVFKILTKKFETNSGEKEYEIQQRKRSKDTELVISKKAQLKYGKIAGERYECYNNLTKVLSEKRKAESFDVVFAKASEYKLLTYNIKLDIENLFISQDEEIQEVIESIHSISPSAESTEVFDSIYSNIKEKDWLYYNNEIRYEFIRKFSIVAERSMDWSVKDKGKKVEPFGMKIKNLSKERVVYLKNRDDLFVQMAYSDLLKTNLVKKSSIIRAKNINTPEKFREAKMEYISHFYSYEKTKNFNNLFNETKFKDGVKVTDEILSNSQQIPTIAGIELKIAENALGLANYMSPTINQMAGFIFEYETGEKLENQPTIVKTETIKEKIAIEEDMFDYAVTYTFEDGSFVGYRLSNI